MKFSPLIFWDVDYNSIDEKKKSRFIIGRVVRYGTVEDWRQLKETYGLEKIKNEMLQERDLDDRTLSFLSCVLSIPKDQFRCYTSKQLRHTHLNF